MIRIENGLVTVLLLLSSVCVFAQGGEVLVGLETATVIDVPSKSTVSLVPLHPPFFDDFSRGGSRPGSSHWLKGSDVYINARYPINPVTLGVATFDALTAKGELHAGASTFPFGADTLTSRPIDVNYPHDTTIYLSFWVQPQGHGNQPETRDSLILEFFDSIDSTWVSIWSASANFGSNMLNEYFHLRDVRKETPSDSLNKQFFNVHIPIRTLRFLSRSFQFRFRNIASLAENPQVPGLRANSDHWHLDLVYLDRQRNFADTLLDDVAIYEPIGSVLNNYEQIPWRHFNAEAKAQEIPSIIPLTLKYRNLG
jgi:hypothetical protein